MNYTPELSPLQNLGCTNFYMLISSGRNKGVELLRLQTSFVEF